MMSPAPESLVISIAHLRTIATPVTDYRVLPFGVAAIDSRLGAGGLRAGALHEATARSGSLVDDAATIRASAVVRRSPTSCSASLTLPAAYP